MVVEYLNGHSKREALRNQGHQAKEKTLAFDRLLKGYQLL